MATFNNKAMQEGDRILPKTRIHNMWSEPVVVADSSERKLRMEVAGRSEADIPGTHNELKVLVGGSYKRGGRCVACVSVCGAGEKHVWLTHRDGVRTVVATSGRGRPDAAGGGVW
jgi:hypothetical protein